MDNLPQVFIFLVIAAALAGCGVNAPYSTRTLPTPESDSKGNMSVPILDAWWDSASGGLRVEYGVAGSALQGPPSYNDGTYSGAAACVRRGIALLTTTSGTLALVQLPQGAPQLITGQIPKAAQIAFSPSCAAAVAFASGNSSGLLVQGLLKVPQSSEVTLPATTSAMAVADSGSILISVPQTDGSAALEWMSRGNGVFQPIVALSKFGGMTLAPGSDTALFADAGKNSLTQASNLGGNLSLVQVAGIGDGISHPVAVGVSADGQIAAVANGVGSSIVRIDLSRKSPATQATCQCSPVELKPTGSNAGFRLNEPGSGTVWAFDANTVSPRIVFLPSAQGAVTAQGAQP